MRWLAKPMEPGEGDMVVVIFLVESSKNVKCNLQEPTSPCAQDALLEGDRQERGTLYLFNLFWQHDIAIPWGIKTHSIKTRWYTNWLWDSTKLQTYLKQCTDMPTDPEFYILVPCGVIPSFHLLPQSHNMLPGVCSSGRSGWGMGSRFSRCSPCHFSWLFDRNPQHNW